MLFPSLIVLAGLSGSLPHQAQGNEFRWHGAVAAGKTIEIVGVNGSIDASGAAGGEVEVVAVKRGRRSDPAEVEIKVIEHADGVTICALYPPGRDREENECRPGGRGHNSTRNNDVNVEWTVKVPRGVRFAGRTVNGDVVGRGLTAEAEEHTVNGSVTVETTSWADATTVNGSITARLGSTDWRGELELTTVNGGITVDLPENASMQVDASTVNGSMSTDFPLTIKGRWGPRRMSGTIGQGGRTLSLSTVNGSMQLRKAP
jgi:putative adhesin